MTVKKLLALFCAAALLPSAILAQPAPAPAPVQTTPGQEVDEEVVGNLDTNAKIAIPAFATNADVATQTSAGGTAALGFSLASVIYGDLKNNGLFQPTGPGSLPRPALAQIQSPDYPGWQSRSTDMLLQGYVRAEADGNVTVGCYLFDVSLGQQLAKAGWTVPPGEWRRAAHKCADLAYARLSGENPFFDSRIAYVAETDRKSVV